MDNMNANETEAFLAVKIGLAKGVLSLAHVVETMRTLPVRQFAGAPAYVAGAAIVRGEAVPVVDLGAMLGLASGAPTRFVVVRAGEHRVVLLVEAVIGIVRVDLAAMPGAGPLLAGVQGETVQAIGALDRELLLVLQTAHIVPDEVWPLVAASEGR